MNDIYIMLKITDSAAQAIVEAGKWPQDLDHYETLLKLGAAHGHAARYHVPEEALPMVIDLVGQRPEITSEEISTLTNIPQSVAENLASRALSEIHENGYPYPWKARAA